jgi:hypothetical protein
MDTSSSITKTSGGTFGIVRTSIAGAALDRCVALELTLGRGAFWRPDGDQSEW